MNPIDTISKYIIRMIETLWLTLHCHLTGRQMDEFILRVTHFSVEAWNGLTAQVRTQAIRARKTLFWGVSFWFVGLGLEIAAAIFGNKLALLIIAALEGVIIWMFFLAGNTVVKFFKQDRLTADFLLRKYRDPRVAINQRLWGVGKIGIILNALPVFYVALPQGVYGQNAAKIFLVSLLLGLSWSIYGELRSTDPLASPRAWLLVQTMLSVWIALAILVPILFPGETRFAYAWNDARDTKVQRESAKMELEGNRTTAKVKSKARLYTGLIDKDGNIQNLAYAKVMVNGQAVEKTIDQGVVLQVVNAKVPSYQGGTAVKNYFYQVIEPDELGETALVADTSFIDATKVELDDSAVPLGFFSKTIRVDAKTKWQDTGIDLIGQKITIKYISGQWSNGSDPGSLFTDARGNQTGTWPGLIVPGEPIRSLVSKVEDRTILIGNDYNGNLGSGRLYLSMNDTEEFADNQGGVVVQIDIYN